VLSAYVGVGGSHVRSQAAHGEADVRRADQEVSLDEVERVITSARQALTMDSRSELLHVIPRGYSLDGVGGIPNPVGMVGFQLAVDACVVSAPLAVTQNLARLLHATGVEPDDLIAGPLAAGESVRAQGEIGLPLMVVDIGAQTTGVALYAEGAIWQCDCLPLGADAITRQMAHELRLPIEVAETLKRRYTTCLPGEVAEDDLIEMEPLSGEDELLPAKLLATCAASGVQELAAALLTQIQRAQRQGARPAMLLLTGGGAELNGLDALLSGALRIPVVVARPAGLMGAPPTFTRPAFAVATGLLLLGARQQMRGMRRPVARPEPLIGRVRRRLNALRGPRAGQSPRR
jgi:cell division protein FtsA